MKFSAFISPLQNAINKTLPAIPAKSTLAILEHFEFKLSGDTLTITATDQDIVIRSVTVVSGSRDGSILVPARKFSEIIKALQEFSVIYFEANDFNISISTDSGKYKLKGLDPDDYLDLSTQFNSDLLNPIALNSDTLLSIVNHTAFATSTDQFGPAMTGVLFQCKDSKLYNAATDSFKLVRMISDISSESDFEFILTTATLENLRKIGGDCTMSQIYSLGSLSHLCFQFEGTTLVSRIINEKFPPYESIIPLQFQSVATFEYSELLSTIKRISLFADQSSRHIKIKLQSDKAIVSANTDDSSYAGNESIPITTQGIESDVVVSFNSKNLMSVISMYTSDDLPDNKIDINYVGTSKPVLIMPHGVSPQSEDDKLLSLVMPVRIA